MATWVPAVRAVMFQLTVFAVLGVVHTAPAAGAQLLGGDEAVFLIAHDQRRRLDGQRPGEAGQAARGGLEHGLVAHQGEELLGVLLARQGPQARAGAAGENDRLQVHG